MAAALSQCKALEGYRSNALTGFRPSRFAKVSNGTKCYMRRKDSYLLEVKVAEEEAEDSAVRRFMSAVVQSRILNQLRARRYKETKIQAYKRRLEERAQIRKLRLVEPTWEELYGPDDQPPPFNDFFDHEDDFALEMFDEMPPAEGQLLNDAAYSIHGAAQSDLFDTQQYNYNNQWYNPMEGGYINAEQNVEGGFVNP